MDNLSPAARRLLWLCASGGWIEIDRVTDRPQLYGPGVWLPVRPDTYDGAQELLAEGLIHPIMNVNRCILYAVSEAGYAIIYPRCPWKWDECDARLTWLLTRPMPRPSDQVFASLRMGDHDGVGQIVQCAVCGLDGRPDGGIGSKGRSWHGTLWWCDVRG